MQRALASPLLCSACLEGAPAFVRTLLSLLHTLQIPRESLPALLADLFLTGAFALRVADLQGIKRFQVLSFSVKCCWILDYLCAGPPFPHAPSIQSHPLTTTASGWTLSGFHSPASYRR